MNEHNLTTSDFLSSLNRLVILCDRKPSLWDEKCKIPVRKKHKIVLGISVYIWGLEQLNVYQHLTPPPQKNKQTNKTKQKNKKQTNKQKTNKQTKKHRM